LVCFVTNKFGKNGGEVLLLLSENAIISKLINLQKSQLIIVARDIREKVSIIIKKRARIAIRSTFLWLKNVLRRLLLMTDFRNLSDAWEVAEHLGGKEACAKEELYDIYYKISIALFEYRIKHGLSQKKLAEKLGVTQPMIAKLESGDYNYTIEQLWKIAGKLEFKFNIEFKEDIQETSVISSPDAKDDMVDYFWEELAVGS